jgi:hypothetical protein
MSKRIDYEQVATKLDYAALNKKLEHLTQAEPPKNRNTALAMLTPLREQLLALHRKGWSNQEIADELKADGVPVSAARLRECLNHWNGDAKRPGKRRANRQPVVTTPQPQPPISQLSGFKSPRQGSTTKPVS